MDEEFEDPRPKYLHGQPQDLTVDQKFRLILRMLRANHSPDLPVKVRRVDSSNVSAVDGTCGICWISNSNQPKSEQYYCILLNKKYPWGAQLETLLHEWAHTLAWHLIEEGKDHGDIFHRYNGVLYRAFIED